MNSVPLKELCFADGCGKYGIPASAELFDILKTRYLRITDISENGDLIQSNKRSVTAPDIDKYILREGDIVFARTGNSTGKTYFHEKKNGDLAYAGFLIKYSLDPQKVNPKYLRYFTISRQYRKWVENLSIGSTRGNINAETFRNCPIHLPSRDQQNFMVKILSSLDRKIELNNTINAELECMAKLVYDYWFVQFDFPNEKDKPYKASGGKMVWCEALKMEIPEGWRHGTLLNLGDIVGGSTPRREADQYFTRDGVPWITPKDLSLNTGNKFITRGETDVSDEGMKSASLNVMPKGTVLLSSRAPIGYLAISRGNVTTNQGFKSFIPNKGFPTEYVYYSIKNMIPTIEKYAVGSTFKEVSGSTLKSIPIPLPNKTIIDRYKRVIENIFSKQNLLELENQELVKTRDWLLPMLMNGQVGIKHAAATEYCEQIIELNSFKTNKPYFHQTQIIAAVIQASRKYKIIHGEMTLAKYSYLLDKIYKVPTLFQYDRWHLGPYPKEMKKVVNNKKFFKIENSQVNVVPLKKKYAFQFEKQIEDAVKELASIFGQYSGKKRSYQTELLATVCKVVEDVKSTDLKVVRDSMLKWPIRLSGEKSKNKSEKFTEADTKKALKLIAEKGWERLLC